VSIVQSLFDAPATPMLPAASEWVTGTLFGDVAASLCVIAIAIVGIMLMIGRLAIREGVRVALACFVLLGAPAIAAGLRSAADDAAGAPALDPTTVPAPLSSADQDG
jgi:type IV secretory pathway VirB2 component (pilin)